jgi:hypothetical protein
MYHHSTAVCKVGSFAVAASTGIEQHKRQVWCSNMICIPAAPSKRQMEARQATAKLSEEKQRAQKASERVHCLTRTMMPTASHAQSLFMDQKKHCVE